MNELGWEIWKAANVVVSLPQSTLTPTSYWLVMNGAKTWPALSVPMGAVGPSCSPWMKLPYTDTFCQGFTTRPTIGVAAASL